MSGTDRGFLLTEALLGLAVAVVSVMLVLGWYTSRLNFESWRSQQLKASQENLRRAMEQEVDCPLCLPTPQPSPTIEDEEAF